jgi:rhodanese-related sulfurtransferase
MSQAHAYQGDIPPTEAMARLKANPQAVLIDVRTGPEWAFVGIPAIERLLRISWQLFPGMAVNDAFVEEVEDAGLAKNTEILLICRSGGRSSAAANALASAGFTNCWNVAQGFEGDRDEHGHRGTIGGWKAAGLPWIQS